MTIPEELRGAVAALTVEDRRNREVVNLVPSETRLSPLAHLPLATDFYNRYFFNEDGAEDFWQFRGGEAVHRLETDLGKASLRRLAGARFVNTRPISGMSAMVVAISALAGPAPSTVVTVDDRTGGHYATAGIARRLGHRAAPVPVNGGEVDEDRLSDALRGGTVSLVYLDLQNSLDELHLAPVVAAIREHSPTTILHVDCSHTLGLVLGGAHANPLAAGADSMGGSTHKSFPGPHKGVLLTNRAELHDRFREAQFGLLSSHHFAETLSLALASVEFEHFGADYAAEVVSNAQALASALAGKGFEVVAARAGTTRTHQVWVRVGDDEETTRFSRRLSEAGIRVNVQNTMPGLVGAIFRLGVNEITFEGADRGTMVHLADLFESVRRREALPAAGAVAVRETFGRPHFFTEKEHPEIFER